MLYDILTWISVSYSLLWFIFLKSFVLTYTGKGFLRQTPPKKQRVGDIQRLL